MAQVSAESEAAFWAKIQIKGPAECWLWDGAKTPKGYGNVRINKTDMKAHRVAWELVNFPIPEGFMVCHACDTPSCCNPGHLLLGSARANFTDMVQKRRGRFRDNKAIGTRNANAKLTASKVAEIRAMYHNREANQYELADQFGVSQAAIGAIVRNKTWRHVSG